MVHVLNAVPEKAKNQVQQLLVNANVDIKIKKKRHTKHGDFRRMLNGSSVITINRTSNSYRFLITLLHELAHFKVSELTHYRVKPHGEEWKMAYREILLPFLNPEIFPEPLCSLLAAHMINPKASTDRDYALVMALKKYDSPTLTVPIIEINNVQQFKLENGRVFEKLKKRRTRFECKELKSGRIYLFSPQVEVFPVSAPLFSSNPISSLR